jgi:uncharacterized protein (DUF924 family)
VIDMSTDAFATADDVLAFWFDGERQRPEWFRKDAAFDATVRERFGATLEAALAGRLLDWHGSPPSALARVLVLDQFTRNAFRDTPRAFAGDALALVAATDMVARGDDRHLAPVQRSFVYLPFEHAEDRAMQHKAVSLFEQLAADAPALADLVTWARKHQEVIERFGRFPHRNAILGRTSTAEELTYLAQPSSGF